MASRMSRRAALLGLTALPILGAGRARAQDSLFDAAKDMLGDFLGGGGLTDGEIAAGLREALRVGSEKVVRQVGRLDGFNADPDIHIPLPGVLKDVQETLQPLGLAGMADDLELKLNRGAEAAAPEAKALFFDAVAEMTLDDVRGIYEGPDDAATQYFKGKMEKPLARRMQPIVSDSLSEVGAVRAYDDMMASYKAIPLVPDVKSDLTRYVVRKGLDGIFYYVAKEEAAIRNDPAARTTELLKKVFGAA